MIPKFNSPQPDPFAGIQLDLSTVLPEDLAASLPPINYDKLEQLLATIGGLTQSNLEATAKWTSILTTIQSTLMTTGAILAVVKGLPLPLPSGQNGTPPSSPA